MRSMLLLIGILLATPVWAQSRSYSLDYLAHNTYYNGSNWVSYATGYGNIVGTNTSTGDYTLYTTGNAGSAGLTRTLTPAMTVTAAGTVSAVAFVGSGAGLTGVTASAAGTTTQLQYNNGGALAGSGVYYVSSSGYVGIGLALPNSKLDVEERSTVLGASLGSSLTIITQYAGDGGNSNYLRTFLRRHTAGGGDWYSSHWRMQRMVDHTPMGFMDFGVDGVAGDYGLGFGSGASTYMVVKNSGNVGIGTTNPAYALDVSASLARLYHTTYSTFAVQIAGDVGYGVALQNYGHAATLNNYNASPLYLATSNTTRLTIDSSGNVGIGTTNPAATLDVSGSIIQVQSAATWPILKAMSSNATSYAPYVILQGSRSGSALQGGDYSGVISFRGAVGESAAINARVPSTHTGSSTPGELAFLTTASGATTTSERMRIDSSGNVGIGTTAPNANLDVVGTVSATNLKSSGTVQLGAYSSAPVACAAGYKGMLAVGSSTGDLCVCNGTNWIGVGTGGTACGW